MNRKIFLIILIFASLSVYLVSGSEDEKADYHIEPAHIEESENEGLPFVVLTEKAVERLNIQTIRTYENQFVIPYSTVRYDIHGDTWVYTNPEPLKYLREQIKIDYVENDEVILLEPIASDKNIVIVGVPELSGVEHGIGQGGGGH
jgi:hypothetical protein